MRRLLGAGAVVAALTGALVYGIGEALTAPPDIKPADAIVVLGGEWPNRIQRGVDLFGRGLAPEIWITGDGNLARIPAKSVDLARREGVPADAIRVLRSDSTWEDGGAAAALAAREGVHSILFVTSWYHSRRALCVMRQRFSGSGVALYHDTVPTWRYGESSWWQNVVARCRAAREVAAFAWYWIHHDLAPWEC